jgi:hypothetical protein
LTRASLLALLEEQALSDWLTVRGPASFGLEWNEAWARREYGLLKEDSSHGRPHRPVRSTAAQANDHWQEIVQRRFLVEWAAQNGVTCPAHCLARVTRQWRQAAARGGHAASANGKASNSPWLRNLLKERALVEWMIKRGPVFFGYDWEFEVALVHELQITSKASQIAARVQAL